MHAHLDEIQAYFYVLVAGAGAGGSVELVQLQGATALRLHDERQ